ncbi:MAG: DUF896 domain-containing protein [Clostridia bacterium]|nr:DUF896 domain-containing protein [Clostridia bacterium]
MEQRKIDRINELARLSRSRSLTDAEKAEQTSLRREYLEAVRNNFKSTLESIKFTERNDKSC